MNMYRAASSSSSSSSSKPTFMNFNPLLAHDPEDLPSPTPPSPAHVAAQQQPSHMETEAPNASVSSESNSKAVFVYPDDLPSPTTSPALLPAQQPRRMEIDTEAPNAAVSSESNSKAVFVYPDDLPSPTTSPALLPAQQPRRMEIDTEAPTAAVSSKVSVVMEELAVTTPPAANPPSGPMNRTLAEPSGSSSKPKFTKPLTVEAIFQDFSARRDALIRALTTDQEEFFDLFGPGENLLLLYGHADGNWEVTIPEETAPSDIPEPALGLNRVRDQMTRFEWLSRVAIRADSWLAGLPRFFGVHLSANQRMSLFDMTSDLPTVHETFARFHDSISLPTAVPPSPDLMQYTYQPNNSSRAPAEENMQLSSDLDLMQNVSNPNMDSSTHAEENMPISPGLIENVSNSNNDSRSTHGEETDEELEEVSDQTFCAACGARYHANGFWICCDICDRWFHGKCVKITASEADILYQYKCPDCKREEIGE